MLTIFDVSLEDDRVYAGLHTVQINFQAVDVNKDFSWVIDFFEIIGHVYAAQCEVLYGFLCIELFPWQNSHIISIDIFVWYGVTIFRLNNSKSI